MRDFKGMKRQRSRNRNGGAGGGGGGGGKPQHNANRAFDSNGPEGAKVRGAAQHVYEKYQQLARDAQTAGDRVLAENYLQHSEHYFRLMRAMQPQRPLSEIIGRDQFVSGYDIDFEDESGGEGSDGDGESDAVDAADERQNRSDGRQNDARPREDAWRQDRPQNDRSQNDRTQSDRTQPDRPQNDRPYAGDRSRNDRVQTERPQAERSAEDRPARAFREDRPRFNREDRAPRSDVQDRSDSDPLRVTEPEATPLATRTAPTPVLRADDGDTSHAPAFLQVRAAEPRGEAAEEVRKPRRRRAPASFQSDAVKTESIPDEG